MNIQWYKDDDELLPALNVKIEISDTESQLRLTKCQRRDSGEVKIKIKNESGTIEAISKLIVLGELTIRDFRLVTCDKCCGKIIICFNSVKRQTNPPTRPRGHYGECCNIC